jgi:hypothetical protein
LDDIEPFGVKVEQVPLQVFQACRSDSRAIFHGTEISDVQLHGDKLCLNLPVGAAYMAQASRIPPIKHPGFWHESNPITRKQDSAEVFSVVISE